MQLPFDSADIPPEEVRQRFRWAKRQGNPAWLWPETRVDEWRDALVRIEAVIRGALAGEPGHQPLEGDAEAIGLACYTSGTGPLLGWWRQAGMIESSPAVGAVLELHLRHNALRAARMDAAAVALVEAFHRRGLRVAVLKGAHTAHDYFPDRATRPASDIDLLVGPADAEAAEAAMRASGYVAAGRGPLESNWRLEGAAEEPKSLRLVHADDPWSVDLHTSLDVLVSAGAPLARLGHAKPLSSRRRWTPLSSALVLEQPLLLIHLAVHAGAGLQNLSLLRLVELHFVIRQDFAAGLLAWDAFLQTGRRVRSLGYAWPALKLCDDLAPGTVPAPVLHECAQHVPPAVLRVLRRLGPGTAQRVDRASIAEHFMWASGIGGRLRQLAFDIAPSRSWSELRPLYQRRMWQLIRGRFSR